jgi:hypothetical protein
VTLCSLTAEPCGKFDRASLAANFKGYWGFVWFLESLINLVVSYEDMKRILVFAFVFMLLFATLISAKVVEIKNDGPFTKVKIIHEHKPDFAKDKPGKPDNPGKPGSGGEKIRCDSSGDIFLDNSVYYLNPLTIPSYLSQGFVVDSLVSSTEEWDQYVASDLFVDAPELSSEIFYGDAGSVYPFDEKNVVVFGDLDSGTIGVTYLWYWTATGEIADWDMMLNTDYTWGDAEVGDYMDLQNILTHELGHSLGLIDLYNRKRCSEVTMFGYSGYNDIGKRSLEGDDILSLLKVYSA